MSQYDVPEPDALMECPYDDTHMVEVRRMPYHLMKCRKNNPNAQMVSCPFNALHEVVKPELRYHMSRCSDRVAITADLVFARMQKEQQQSGGNTQMPIDDWVPPPCDENWDDDEPQFLWYRFESPNKKKAVASMTVAEKKAFHARNRVNYKRKMEGLPPLDDDEPLPETEAAVRKPNLPAQSAGEAPSVYEMAKQQMQADGITNLKLAGIRRGGRGWAPAPVSLDALSLTSGFSGTSAGTVGSSVVAPRPAAAAQAAKQQQPPLARMAGIQQVPQPSATELLRAQAMAQQVTGRGRRAQAMAEHVMGRGRGAQLALARSRLLHTTTSG